MYYPVEETENTAQSRQTYSGAHWDSVPPCLSDEERQLFPTLFSCTTSLHRKRAYCICFSNPILIDATAPCGNRSESGAVSNLWQVGQRTSAQHVFIFNKETQEACRRSPGFHFSGAWVDENKGCKMDFMRRYCTVTVQGLKAQLAQRAGQDHIMDIKG